MTSNGGVLVLGGSRWQADFIRSLRDLGLRTIVADISAEAPGRAHASEFEQVDTNDVDTLVDIARKHAVRLVITDQTDRTVPVAAAVNERLHLPGISAAVARRFTDKLAMRRALVASDVPMPAFAEVRSAREVREHAEQWGYPVVIKPKAAQSSFGVTKINSEAGIEPALPSTLRRSADGAFLVEQFIEGTEITVEALSLDGECRVMAVSEKEHYPFNDCVARRLAYPPRFDEELMMTIRRTATGVVEHLGLRDGISHAEYRVRDRVPYLVEVAARGGGSRIASVIAPHVSGVNMYALLVRKLLGEDVRFPPVLHRAALLEFLDFRAGKVAAIHGLDRVQADPTVYEISLAFKEGDTIERPDSDATRVGHFIVLADTRDEIDEKSREIKAAVQITYA